MRFLFINLHLKVYMPFEISNQLYSEQLENALKESRTIEKEYKVGKRTGYNNAAEIVRTILN